MKNASGMIFGILGVVLLVLAGVAGRGSSITAQEGGDDVRVMTYNIKHGQGNDECEDEQGAEGTPPASQCAVDLERTAEVIASQEPDIVALQEVDRSWARSGGVDQPTELVQSLDMNACFGSNLDHEPDEHADEPHQYGTLILSVYPILSCDNTFLPTPEGWEQRGLLEVRVEIDGVGEVAILNTHLQAGREGENDEAVRQRTEQADTIAARIADLDVPVILMGDFNAEPDDDELSSLRDPELGLLDAWQVAGDEELDGYTSPASPDEDAERRIDVIFVSSDLEVVSAEVPVTDDSRISSDHYPVVADLNQERGTPEATPIVATDGTPDPAETEEAPPVGEPTVITAPTTEPPDGAVPQTPEVAVPTSDSTEESGASPTRESEALPTEEPDLPPTDEPVAQPTEEPEAQPTDEPETREEEPAGDPQPGSSEPADEDTGDPAD